MPQGGNTGLVGAGVPDASGRLAVPVAGQPGTRIRALDPERYDHRRSRYVLDRSSRRRPRSTGCYPLALGAPAGARSAAIFCATPAASTCCVAAWRGTGPRAQGCRPRRRPHLGRPASLAQGRHRLRSRARCSSSARGGRLGVITAAIAPAAAAATRAANSAWLAVPSPRAAVALLGLVRDILGETVSSLSCSRVGAAVRRLRAAHPAGRPRPAHRPAPWCWSSPRSPGRSRAAWAPSWSACSKPPWGAA